MKKFDNCRIILVVSFALLVLSIASCSKLQEQANAEHEEITGSVIEEQSENCRFSDQSDCRPIEITRAEQTEEEANEIPVAESPYITDNLEENLTSQNEVNLTPACEAGWRCVEKRYIAYQEGNCSWRSLERCIHGCNENESACRTAPICKVDSLKCENNNLMICGEDGYRWLLKKSCDEDCEDNACTEDLSVNATQNTAANDSNNTAQTDFISDGCISILKYNLTGYNPTDEYFTLKNSCSYTIDLSGWTASDDANHVYTFPSFNLANDGEVTIITGNGNNSQTTLYWGRGSAVWNNDGDTLYLNTSSGTSVLIKTLTP